MKAFNKIALGVSFLALSIVTRAADITPIAQQPGQDSIRLDRQEFTRSFNKTFSVNPNILVILSNKYGKVNVKTNGGNQAIVNVVIKVQANSQGEADKTFDRVNIAFSDGPDYVKAETMIESQNSWWSWNSGSSDFAIDYEVVMPAANKLDISNKYGNSNIAALNSWVKIDQKYGDFKLEGSGSATVNLAYGGGSIGKTSGLTATVSYGKLSAEDTKDVALKSKYSEFRLNKVNNLVVTSAYDDYKVTSVENFSVDSKYGDMVVGNVDNIAVVSAYTDIKVKKVETSATFQTSYGDVRIDGVKSGFGAITIKGAYTDYVIGVEPTASYQLDVSTSYGDVNQPASLTTRVDKEKGSTKEIMGYVGSPNTKSVIKAQLSYGDLIIK